MKSNWFNIAELDIEEWKRICPINEYRVVDPEILPGVVPDELKRKLNSVLILASGEPNGIVYYMANLLRVDAKDLAIDQQPFGLAFVGNKPVISGCIIQHGKWQDRTTRPPIEFWEHIMISGISSCFPLSEIPSKRAGSISELRITSHNEAFKTIVLEIQKLTGLD